MVECVVTRSRGTHMRTRILRQHCRTAYQWQAEKTGRAG
jgi:hypothetical protein